MPQPPDLPGQPPLFPDVPLAAAPAMPATVEEPLDPATRVVVLETALEALHRRLTWHMEELDITRRVIEKTLGIERDKKCRRRKEKKTEEASP